MFKNKKVKKTENSELNTLENQTEDLKFGVKTIAIENNKKNLDWVSGIKTMPFAIITAIGLLGGIATSANYSYQLDKNRQKIAYIADLRQLSERIEKSALQARSGSKESFHELQTSENSINNLLEVLKNGGKISVEDTKIDGISGNYVDQFNKVTTEWTNNKPLLDALIAQETNLTQLKVLSDKAREGDQDLLDAASTFGKVVHSDNVMNNTASQELFVLSNRITEGLNDLFSGETFSLEKGYMLVKDLREFQQLINTLRSGSDVYGIQPMADANALTLLNAVQKAFTPFQDLAEKVVKQVPTLNNAKDVALQVSNSSKNIVNAAENLDTAVTQTVNDLVIYRYISVVLFLISLVSIGILAFVFYERSLVASRAARELEKNQNNQNAVNLLMEQMEPIDQGDFTKRVYVSDKFVTQIAEKVDNTREILGNIVRKIKNTSEDILSAADNTDGNSHKLLEVSNIQFSQMETSIQKLGNVTSEMDEVAQTTWIAQEESNQSKQASQEGERLVSQSIVKMDQIKNNIQESSKKIKKSSESAQAITEVTGLIQNITKQIEVLALNAAIQAASSGEAGREFTIVAQEVQRLAVDSKEATQQILRLVKDVQEDIGGAVSSMEKTTQEVVEGAKLTDNAGQALKRIEVLSQQVADRVAEASAKLEEKSSDMTQISLEMKDLQTVTQKSVDIIKVTANQVESLKKISQELTNTVHGYKVE